MNNINIHRLIFCLLSLLLLPYFGFTSEVVVNKRARMIEIKADRAFIRGDYDNAMKLFTKADEKLIGTTPQKLNLELKMARLYILLQSPQDAIRCYNAVQQSASTTLTVNDVCFYIDALRQSGETQQAEIVARQYAFMAIYSRNQRYLNMLYSLSNLQRYYGKGDSDFAVKLWDKNLSLPEYWMGEFKNDVFYAVSNSRIQDPLKIFYHQTQYFALTSKKPMPFKSIPRELQSGPVAFSEGYDLMVATGISYRKSDRIEDVGTYQGMFLAQLYYSLVDQQSGGWRRFETLFEFQEENNYAHPAFFNGGKSLVFSSDRPGGYGGMDLYIAHWDEATRKWGEPINMGEVVNTEGDEIYPRIVDNGLYFASNGLAGYGGYDIYRVSFGRNIVLPGSLFHYPYPINTANNDFGIFFNGNTGYFISDRRGMTGKDDIYTFDATVSPLSSISAIGVSDEYTAMAGNLNIIKGLKSSNTETFDKELLITPTYRVPEQNEVMLSVYFDFNSNSLDDKSISELKALLNNPALDEVKELSLLGYADEFGSQQYNVRLSTQRADAVAEFMTRSGVAIPKLFIEGRGKLTLSPEEYFNAVKQTNNNIQILPNHEINMSAPSLFSFEERVKLNRKLRRVDIVVKKK